MKGEKMKYDAFISYRHTPLDMKVARNLHKALETYHIPKAVRKKTGKKKITRVFRDQEELPTSSSLSANIDEALKESEYLIVICSPDTPGSQWVEREITAFIELHGRDHVLALLIAGEPEESFPEPLRHDKSGLDVEPLAADIRAWTDRGRMKKLRVEKLRLLAAILGCSYDDLKQRQRERKIKITAVVAAAVALFMLAFGIYSFYNMTMIRKNYRKSQVNESEYLAEKSLSLSEGGDSRQAALVAKEALPSAGSNFSDRPYVPNAEYAMQQALNLYMPLNSFTLDYVVRSNAAPTDVHFSNDGELACAGTAGGEVNVWETASGNAVAFYPSVCNDSFYQERVIDAYMSGKNVVTVYEDYISCRDLSGNEIWKNASENSNDYTAYDQKTGYLAVSAINTLTIYDTGNGNAIYSKQADEDSEYTFGNPMKFNSDGTELAVAGYKSVLGDESSQNTDSVSQNTDSVSQNGQDNGIIYLIDLKNKKDRTVVTKRAYITDIIFSGENSIVVSTTDQMLDFSADTAHIYSVEYIELNPDKALWENETEMRMSSFSGMSMRVYDSVPGYIVATVDNEMICYSAKTGEKISELSFGTSVAGAIFQKTADDTGISMVIEIGGQIDYVNILKGIQYPDNMKDTGMNISKVTMGKGRVYFKKQGENSIVDFCVLTGPGYEKISEYDKGSLIYDVKLSPDEKMYSVNTGETDSPLIEFRNTKDNSLINTWKSDDGYVMDIRFVSNDKAVIILNDKKCFYFSVKTGKTKDIHTKFEDDKSYEISAALMNYYFSDNGKYLIAELNGKISIVRLSDGKATGPFETSDKDEYKKIVNARISPDGSKLYYVTNEDGICCIDTKSGKTERGLAGGLRIYNGAADEYSLCISDDGKYLAVACNDSTLKLIELESGKTVSEIPFYSTSKCFLSFAPDSKVLFAQGDDGNIKALAVDSFNILNTENSASTVTGASYFTDEKIAVMTAENGLYVFDTDTCGKKSEISGGLCISPKNDKVISKKNVTLGYYPYMRLNDIMDEEGQQFGDSALSDSERAALFTQGQ